MKHLISGIAFALVGLFAGCKRDIDKHVDKVQLWESGPYWAMTNIGAEKPEDYGLYFWWGDTVGYRREGNAWVASDGSSRNFEFSGDNAPTYCKINSELQSEGWITSAGVLVPEHDAAHIHWGGAWRMPTRGELFALNSKCDWTWTMRNGVNGYVVRGRGDYSEASIFLPAAGYGYGTSLNYAGSDGYCWSSVPRSDSGSSWGLYFDSGRHDADIYFRYNWLSVRHRQGRQERLLPDQGGQVRGLEQLAKEPARRNGDRRLVGKGVGVGVWQVADDLEGVRCPGCPLHGGERRRDFRVGHLRLSQEPGVAVLGHKEIDLLLRLVADVVEGVVAESEVVPHINGLGEMACDKVLETRPFVRDLAPVALVPLWRLANRVLDVPEPRTHRETFVEVFERRLPRLDCRLGDAYLAGEGCRGDHVAGAGEEEFRKDADAGDVGDLREVANILPEKLLPAELAPADGEAPVMPYERFGEAAVFPEGVPVGLGDGAWRVGFPDFEFGADKFGDPKGVHVVEEVASHKAVAAALVDVEACAARDNEAHAVLVDVEEALDEVFPSDELVDFVEGEDWPVAGGDVKPRRSREAGGVPGDKPPRCEVVPSEVVVGE